MLVWEMGSVKEVASPLGPAKKAAYLENSGKTFSILAPPPGLYELGLNTWQVKMEASQKLGILLAECFGFPAQLSRAHSFFREKRKRH